jgi:DNA polymerase
MKSGCLVCRLPNGRELFYQQPTIRKEPNKFRPEELQSNLYYKSHKGWIMMGGWVWMENVGQGTARDLLCEPMRILDRENVYVIMSEHDKLVIECAEDDDDTPKLVTECMQVVPPWAKGLPIKTETLISKRFAKDLVE